MSVKPLHDIPKYYLHDIPNKLVPLPHHTRGLSYTASGYGRRIPTQHMVQLPGSTRWRRVYACISSNLGTCYVGKSKTWEAIIR